MGDTLDSVVQNWSYSRPPSTITNNPAPPPPPKLPDGLQTPTAPSTAPTPQTPPVPPPPSGKADPSDPTSMPSSAPPPDSTPPLPTPPVPPTTPPPAPAQVPDGLQPKTVAPGTGTPLAPALSTVAARQPTDTGLPTPVTDTPRWQEMSPTQLYNPQFPPVAVAIGQPESGMQNIRQRIKDPVTGQLQPAGQGTGPASGYFQIEDDTWKFYAPKMGVDLTKWPTAMSAPPQVQWAVAQSMPLNRWSRGTYAAFRQQYPWVNGNMTLGQINAQAGGTDEYGVPRQYLVAATEREAGARFQPDPSWNSGTPGMMPSSWDIPRIMSGTVPQLLALGLGLFARVPLINAIAAYGAMAKAQQNGQLLDYQMNKDKWQTALKEHNAMQTMEGQDVDDALIEFKDNPEDMKQAMMGIARRYNDPNLNMMAQQERFDLIDQLQKKRDMLNQPLQKALLAQQKVADEQAKVAAVQAKDAQFLKDNPDATPGEIAEEHVKNMGEVAREAKPTAASTGEEAQIQNVIGADGKPTGQQVREGKDAGLFDVSTNKPYTLKPGETLSAQPKAGASTEGLAGSKLYDVIDKDGNTVQSGIELRESKNKAGYVHAEDGSALELKPGEHVRQTTPTTTTGGRAGAQTLRQIIGGREVLSDLQNVSKLKVGTTIGPLGGVNPGPTIAGALTGDLTRHMTDQESQLMQASLASVKRELSTLLSPVYGGNYASEQIDPLIPKSGDTLGTVMFKIARIKQTADNALEGLETAPWLDSKQKGYVTDLRKQIDSAINWNTDQALEFATRGQKGQTFAGFVQSGGLSGGQAPSKPGWADQQYSGPGMVDTHGRHMWPKNGKWYYDENTPVPEQ